jgi:hypothetical protein
VTLGVLAGIAAGGITLCGIGIPVGKVVPIGSIGYIICAGILAY